MALSLLQALSIDNTIYCVSYRWDPRIRINKSRRFRHKHHTFAHPIHPARLQPNHWRCWDDWKMTLVSLVLLLHTNRLMASPRRVPFPWSKASASKVSLSPAKVRNGAHHLTFKLPLPVTPTRYPNFQALQRPKD